jgi:ribulose-5-phosphate 4-epimerase/fuculose-1-phosphate aldolase
MMSETGSVKFTCDRVKAKLTRFAGFDELNRVRRRLIDLGLMGVDSNGIGFGNLSVRDGETNSFYITGSGTGGMEELKLEHCAKVTAFDFGRNWLRCEGSTIASSESLTHAAVYESDPSAAAAIHGHDLELWAALLDQVPTTGRGVEYGTPAMAGEVRRLFKMTDVKSRKIFVMAGHEGGVVAFGKDLADAFGVVTGSRNRSKSGK